MRLAVLSDIHGNATALDAVLADLGRRPADRVVCLGDTVQSGAQPAEVVERLRSLACPVVMGNADAWLFSGIDTGAEPRTPQQRAILEDVRVWSLSRLTAADREFISGFVPMVALDCGGRSFVGYHGSPASFDEILLPDTPREAFERAFAPCAADFMAGGHVHLQFARRFGDSTHFNPGSIGIAYRHDASPGELRIDPWAEYAVLEVEGARVSLDFRRVPYDVNEYVRILRASGRPHAEEAIRHYGGPR